MNDYDKLGPILSAPASYLELRSKLRSALGFPNDWKPLLIGIDGPDGAGKSALAAWLSWQLEMPAVHLDMYLIRDRTPIEWRYDDLARVLEERYSLHRPVIVEGVLLLDALNTINRKNDFLVFVDRDEHETNAEYVTTYLAQRKPAALADYILRWSSAQHDQRVMDAHLRRRRGS